MSRYHRHGSRQRTRSQRVLLAAGFLALTAALLAGRRNPAVGYELSIYDATPTAFWVCTAGAMASALLVAARTRVQNLRRLALVLAASSMLAIVALPLVRGYYFYGQGDSLSHLGFARSFASGALDPWELLHPGVHLTAIVLDAATGLPLRQTMLLTVVVFFLLFFVFVPLCVREIASSSLAAVVGLFTALLLLPINSVGTHIVTHPSSQAVLFAPLVLFLSIRYLRRPATGRFQPSAIGVLLALTSLTLLLVHPQETMDVIIIFWTVLLVQRVVSRYRASNPIANHRTFGLQAGYLTVLWLLWAPRSGRVSGRLERAVGFLLGRTGGAGGTEVSGQSASLASIGGSIEELFVKLFLVAALCSVVAGLVMVASVLGRLDHWSPDRNAYLKYLSLAFVPLAIGTSFVFLGSFGDHYFRFIGFLMVVVTLVAAAGFTHLFSSDERGAGTRRLGLVVLFALLLPLATLSLHPSPWIYQDTAQVTEQEYVGYETAFEHDPDTARYAGIRSGGERYMHAIEGPRSQAARTFFAGAIPFRVFGHNLTTHYDEPVYVPVRASDVGREVQLYNGFRYDREGFVQLQRSRQIARIQSTDEFRLYRVAEE